MTKIVNITLSVTTKQVVIQALQHERINEDH